jgi:hypothetical protein
MAKAKATPALTELELFLRLWDRAEMTRASARQVLRMEFTAAEQERVHELSVKNQEGAITPAELEELDAFIRVDLFVSTLQSRARRLLKEKAGTERSRG